MARAIQSLRLDIPTVNTETRNTPRRRLFEVDRTTAFAIFLVVLGHVVAREPPAHNEWYVNLKYMIYQFHMPLFMFLSGLIFQLVYVPVTNASDFLAWMKKKVTRLAPGYLLIGTAIIFGKILASNFIHVDNIQYDVVDSYYKLFIEPKSSAGGSLWYIYVLLEFYILFPLIIELFRARSLLILMLVIVMHIMHLVTNLSDFLMVDAVFEYALYFYIGCLACTHYEHFLSHLQRRGFLWLGLFLICFGSIFFLDTAQSKSLIGLASIPALFFIIGMRTKHLDPLLLLISKYTFSIYLLNTIAIGVTKGIMLKVLPWDGVNFYVYFIVLAAAGMVGPIIAYRLIFARIKPLRRIMI